MEVRTGDKGLRRGNRRSRSAQGGSARREHSRAVATIEEFHPGRTVHVVFPIDPEEFFVEDSQDGRTGHDRSGTLVQDTVREAWAF